MATVVINEATYKVTISPETQGSINIIPAKGEKGDPGDTGPANTLSIGTVQGGATAAATITGTAPNQTLNLTLPKGDKGDSYTITQADYDAIASTVEDDLQPTIEAIENTAETAEEIAKGANQALSFASYSAMITHFNAQPNNQYKVGQNVMIVTLEVPDLWISEIAASSSTYTYVDDATFTAALATNGYVQVGYYKLSALETQKVDLTDYVTNTDYATSSTGGVIKTTNNYATATSSGNGFLYAQVKTYEQYNASNVADQAFISKGTLENVITGKGLVSDTDYASFSKAGLIKPSGGVGTDIVSSTGVFYASTLDYATYNSANNGAFVGKGTLENVIAGKGLVDQTALAGKQDKLTAGTNITIDANNVISATGGGGTVSGETIYYGLSSTAAATQAKTVTVDNGFTLHDGVMVRVLFANAQTYNGAATLNVNSTGAKTVQYKSGTGSVRYMWQAGQVVDFVYRESSDTWIMPMGALATTTYYGITKLSTSAISTSTAMASTPATINALMENMVSGAPAYVATNTYAVGDRVRYGSMVYVCNTAITTPEAWNSAHWTQVDDLQTQIDSKQDTLTAGTGISISNGVISATGGITYYDFVTQFGFNPLANGYNQDVTITQAQYEAFANFIDNLNWETSRIVLPFTNLVYEGFTVNGRYSFSSYDKAVMSGNGEYYTLYTGVYTLLVGHDITNQEYYAGVWRVTD